VRESKGGASVHRRLIEITKSEVDAVDGRIGTVFDFFFDDEAWQVRYLVVDTGTWIQSRKILLAIEGVELPDDASQPVVVKYPRELIRRSPHIDLAKPVTHLEENMVRRHYGAWPHWAPYLVGAGPHKLSNLRDKAGEDLGEREHISTYALHSLLELHDFHVRFNDDVEEKLVDLLIDPGSWEIQRFVVRRGIAGMGKEFAVARDRLTAYDPETKELSVSFSADEATSIEDRVPAS
jgi:hypothetical protein